MSATPRPWRLDNVSQEYIVSDDNKTIAACVTRRGHETMHLDNAALIVRAVNCHDDMLAALKLLVADVADYEAWQRPCHALDVACAAIAKAEAAPTDDQRLRIEERRDEGQFGAGA